MERMPFLKGVFALLLLMLQLTACNGQAPGRSEKRDNRPSTAQADTPEVDIRVNKQYDEHGNLIAFDSSYTVIRRGFGSDPQVLDSLFREFRKYFRSERPLLDDPGFNDLFFRDSLLHYDFFKDDFFRRRMELNRRYMDRMMAEMDSLKNRWFQDRVPERGRGR